MGVSMGRDIKALGRSISGGRSGAYEEEVAKGVQEALRELEENAAALGADALIAVDVDYAEVGNNMLMVAATGTAVKLCVTRARHQPQPHRSSEDETPLHRRDDSVRPADGGGRTGTRRAPGHPPFPLPYPMNQHPAQNQGDLARRRAERREVRRRRAIGAAVAFVVVGAVVVAPVLAATHGETMRPWRPPLRPRRPPRRQRPPSASSPRARSRRRTS